MGMMIFLGLHIPSQTLRKMHTPSGWRNMAGLVWSSGRKIVLCTGRTAGEFHQTTWVGRPSILFRESGELVFSFNADPHHPFESPAEYLDRFNAEDMPLPSEHPARRIPVYFQPLDRTEETTLKVYTEAMSDNDRRQVCTSNQSLWLMIR